MGKRLFLLIIASLMGVVSTPGILMATDEVMVTGVSNVGVTETVPEPESEPETEAASGVVYGYAPAAPVAGAAVAPVPANNIQINGRTVELLYTGSTGEDAGAAVQGWYHSTGKYIYGHNYDYVFGSLDTAYDGGWLGGMVFTVTMNGVTTNYQIVNYRLYDYNPNDQYNVYYNGQVIEGRTFTGARMKNATGVAADAYRAGRDDAYYDLALMTCYAGSSKRLVVFANVI